MPAECSTDKISAFLLHVGVSGGTGRYAVRKQVIRDGKLYIAVEDYDDEKSALDYHMKPLDGEQFSVAVDPTGKVLASEGCPTKKSGYGWLWWLAGGVALVAAAVGGTVWIRRRRSQAST